MHHADVTVFRSNRQLCPSKGKSMGHLAVQTYATVAEFLEVLLAKKNDKFQQYICSVAKEIADECELIYEDAFNTYEGKEYHFEVYASNRIRVNKYFSDLSFSAFHVNGPDFCAIEDEALKVPHRKFNPHIMKVCLTHRCCNELFRIEQNSLINPRAALLDIVIRSFIDNFDLFQNYRLERNAEMKKPLDELTVKMKLYAEMLECAHWLRSYIKIAIPKLTLQRSVF